VLPTNLKQELSVAAMLVNGIEFDKRYKYIMPDHWWRIVLWVGNNSNLFFYFFIF
jgi:uncharacterized membrane protein